MKALFTLIGVVLLLSDHAFSQAPLAQWNADFGGNDFEQFAVVQQTKDGGYIAGGYSSSGISGDKTRDSRGSDDYWIACNKLQSWPTRGRDVLYTIEKQCRLNDEENYYRINKHFRPIK